MGRKPGEPREPGTDRAGVVLVEHKERSEDQQIAEEVTARRRCGAAQPELAELYGTRASMC